MTYNKSIKNTAIFAFTLYMLTLFWVLILKCNMRQGIIEFRYTYEGMPLYERVVFFMSKFTTTNKNEALMNVVAFIPMGMVVPFIAGKKPYLAATMAGFFISLGAELVQLLTAFGGFAYIDIINNVLGTLLGIVILCILKRIMTERWLNFGMTVVSILAIPLLIYALINTINNIDIYILPPREIINKY